MWYTVSFIAGMLIGVISMAILAASSADDHWRENEWLRKQLRDKEAELRVWKEHE